MWKVFGMAGEMEDRGIGRWEFIVLWTNDKYGV